MNTRLKIPRQLSFIMTVDERFKAKKLCFGLPCRELKPYTDYMKILYTFLALIVSCSMFSQLNMTYRGNITYNQELSDIWGYAAPDGSEYALVGVYNGVSLVDVNNPDNPTELFFFPGANSIWRDIKTWGSFAYVTNESSQGVMVIDMTDLPNTATATNWTPTIPGVGTISSCHNIWIDELGYAYLVGCNINSGGMIYVDVSSTPGVPIVAGVGPAVYAHDTFVRNNLAYASEIYGGVFSIYNVADKNNTILLGSAETEGNFTHNAWLSEDNTILYTTDEVSNAPIGAYNVTDPTDVQELDQFRPLETLGAGVIPHNVHVWDDWLIVSYYTDGCILVDGSNPTNLIEVGNFDTFIPASSGFNGAWGAYPYLPSGLVLISDIGNGMYVLEPNYVNACWLEGIISDASSGLGITGASVVLTTTNVTELSGIQGAVATGYAIPGTYTVNVIKGGYEPASIDVELINGVITPLDVQMQPLENFMVSGTVISSFDGSGIGGAQIFLTDGDIETTITADGNGAFTFPNIFSGTYELVVGQWGFQTECEELVINGAVAEMELNLSPGFMDDFSLDFGWTKTNTAVTGIWERAIPVGTMYFNFASNPNEDIQDDCSGLAYVTGNGGGDAGTDDVDDGEVILNSPEFFVDLATQPVMSYYRWFANYDNTVANDLLRTYLVSGNDTYLLETLSSSSTMSEWVGVEIYISDFITESGMYHFRMVTADDVGNGSIVEAGLDGFRIDNTVSVNVLDEKVKLEVSPNPSNTQFALSMDRTRFTGQAIVRVFDATGRKVLEERPTMESSRMSFGAELNAGTYSVQVCDEKGLMLSKPLTVVKY